MYVQRKHQQHQRYLLGLAIMAFVLTPLFANATGLKAEIESVKINDLLKPEVTFTLQDNEGAPLSLDDVETRFIIARLDVINEETGSARYWSYNHRQQVVPDGEPNAGASAMQATYDSGGEYTELGAGRYLYTFATALPIDYDRSKTHTVGAQMEIENDEGLFVANPLHHFVPSGAEVVHLRKVATTKGCNECHNGMGIHGGGRRDVGLCILCHSPQSIDPDTGNSVDMTEMIHKIHMGSQLPSVQNDEPYQIVGFRQSVHDYSNVVFPMDIRNCQTCHDDTQGHLYKTAPTRQACGSCHDDVNFETGENHGPQIAQSDDQLCALCHKAEAQQEFDFSIPGAHVIPTESEQLKGLTAEIINIENAVAGQTPTVTYAIKEDDGTVVVPTDLATVAITYAWQTEEYKDFVRENAPDTSVDNGDGTFSYTFSQPLPEDAEGTFTFSMEARRLLELNETNITESAFNPISLVNVSGEEIQQRRQIADVNKCNVCHKEVVLHGSLRKNFDYCVTCHNPNVSDIGRRPEGVQGGESVSFGYMIHKIHKGHDLEQPYTVYGYGNQPHDYTHVLFPGKNNKCSICHVEDVPSLPLPDVVNPINFINKEGEEILIAPTAAACISCHDSEDAVNHANNFVTNSGVESCAACHQEGASADIVEAHAVNEFLNVEETIAPPSTSIRTWNIH